MGLLRRDRSMAKVHQPRAERGDAQGAPAHCDEFLVHAVDEGKQSGVEADLVSALGEWSPIPVTYAGGARSLADLRSSRGWARGG